MNKKNHPEALGALLLQQKILIAGNYSPRSIATVLLSIPVKNRLFFPLSR